MYVSTGIVTNSGRASALVIVKIKLSDSELSVLCCELDIRKSVLCFKILIINLAFLGSERH